MEYLNTLVNIDAAIWNQLVIGYAIAGLMGVIAVTMRLLWEPTSICRLPGGTKVDASTWMLLAAVLPAFALFLCFKLRQKVELADPEISSAGQVLRYGYIAALPLCVMIVAAVATYPMPTCDSPERLAGLEKGLRQSGVLFVAAKSATLQSRGLVSETCRVLVDVQWPGDDKLTNVPYWYQIVWKDGGGWGSYINQNLQKFEHQYQYDLLRKR